MPEFSAIPGPLGRRHRTWRMIWKRNLAPLARLMSSVLPRSIDILLSGGILLLLSPFVIARSAYARTRNGHFFDREVIIGRYHEPFDRLRFAGRRIGRELPVLINIFRGDMSWVGPRPMSETEFRARTDIEGLRFLLVPGLVSSYRLRQKVGIAYEAEAHAERDMFYGASTRRNLGVLGRSLVTSALSSDKNLPSPDAIEFFGVPVVNTTMQEAVDWLLERAAGSEPALLSFVNPDCLNIAYRDDHYRRILGRSARVLPDGIGLRLGCRVLGVAMQANVNGTDLFPRLCERAAATGLPIFLLGARPGIADLVAENIMGQYPGLKIAGTQHGYFSPEDEDAVIARINQSGARILLAAFGAPRQEKWLDRHHRELTPPVRMGVGGLLDFYSGRMPRAPLWMREIGLEWLFRLSQEPGRLWRRYVIGNPLFLYRVWLQSRGVS